MRKNLFLMALCTSLLLAKGVWLWSKRQELPEFFIIQVNWTIWQSIVICDRNKSDQIIRTNQIIIVSRASLESQHASYFVHNATILKETRATYKINEKTPGVFWPPSIHKRDKDSRKPLEIILNFYLFVISIESSY